MEESNIFSQIKLAFFVNLRAFSILSVFVVFKSYIPIIFLSIYHNQKKNDNDRWLTVGFWSCYAWGRVKG